MHAFTIEPKKVQLDAFSVAGLQTRTSNATEQNPLNPAAAKIPGLWGNFMAQNVYGQLAKTQDAAVFGVYTEFASDVNGEYSLIAGLAVGNDFSHETFKRVDIPAGNYLVFSLSGIRPQVVINTWIAIWQYFNAHPEIQRSYGSDFEKYVGAEGIEIYIGVVN